MKIHISFYDEEFDNVNTLTITKPFNSGKRSTEQFGQNTFLYQHNFTILFHVPVRVNHFT